MGDVARSVARLLETGFLYKDKDGFSSFRLFVVMWCDGVFGFSSLVERSSALFCNATGGSWLGSFWVFGLFSVFWFFLEMSEL